MKPGEEMIDEGLRDLAAGDETVFALLVAIGAPRLRNIGINLPQDLPASPEHRLYLKLAADDPDSAHSRFQGSLAAPPNGDTQPPSRCASDRTPFAQAPHGLRESSSRWWEPRAWARSRSMRAASSH